MAINTTAFAAALQTKMDATTDAKEMLLLGKAYESTEANIVLADVNAAGVVTATKAAEALASATSATSSASSATTSASTATTKAGEASISATSATGSATTATTKASEASTSATTATTKAGEASSSATAAATSASSAASAATTAVNAVIDTAPANLDTLNELALALGNDANYAATITTALAGKEPADATIVKDADIGTTVQGYSAVLGATTASFLIEDETKLDGIETGATADQTQSDINALGITAVAVDLGNWTVTESAGVVYFATLGVNKMKLDASGNITVVGDVTAFGTI